MDLPVDVPVDLPIGAQWLDKLSVSCGTVLTIGVLDGVHLGHQHLLRQVVSRAREIGGCSGALTFDPHPQVVVSQGMKLAYLVTLEDRVRLIRDQGIDIVAILNFTRDVSRLSPEDFIEMLLRRIKMVELWVGPDFALGHRRSGTIPVLSDIGKRKGFTVNVVSPFETAGVIVSSTEIRRLLGTGQVKEAATMLGRNPSLTGIVASGFQRGRTIGIPTANLEVAESLLTPADGVYAVYVHFDARRWLGVVSIGTRPTFDDGERRTVEVHILDFDGDLYGRSLRLEFIERLRDEMRFADVDQLVQQIHSDIEQARAILGR